METIWDYIKYVYRENWGVPGYVIEFFACESILSRCACGQSNYRIALGVKENMQYVRSVINHYYGFDGWNTDIDFNPLAIFNKTGRNYSGFFNEITGISSLSDKYNLKFIYNICKRYVFLKERCMKEYDKCP